MVSLRTMFLGSFTGTTCRTSAQKQVLGLPPVQTPMRLPTQPPRSQPNERAEAGARTPSGSDPHEASHSTAQKSTDPLRDDPTHGGVPGHTSTTLVAAQNEIVVIEDVEPEITSKSVTSNVLNKDSVKRVIMVVSGVKLDVIHNSEQKMMVFGHR